nr:hypothetical protein [Streptomyces sp. CC53]
MGRGTRCKTPGYGCTARVRGIPSSARCKPAPSIAIHMLDQHVEDWRLGGSASGARSCTGIRGACCVVVPRPSWSAFRSRVARWSHVACPILTRSLGCVRSVRRVITARPRSGNRVDGLPSGSSLAAGDADQGGYSPPSRRKIGREKINSHGSFGRFCGESCADQLTTH